MSSYFTKPSPLARFVLARAADINDRVDAVETAFDLAEAAILTKLGAVDAMGGDIPNAATRANKVLYFNGSGIPSVGAYLDESDVTAAAASAAAAASSASAASTSASNASSSASSAASSASAASTSATNAQTAETNAETAETNAETAETNAEAAAVLAQAWAVNPEDDDVAGYVGQFSALHWAAKAEDQAIAASGSASAASGSASSASSSASAASDSAADALVAQGAAEAAVLTAAEWAENPEDNDITSAPGQYSALHWAAKAADSAAAAALFDPSSYVPKTGGEFTGAVTFSAASGAAVSLNAAAGTARGFAIYSGASLRWSIQGESTAEGGSNAGTNFRIRAYDDSATAIGTAFEITRATMAAIFGGKVTLSASTTTRASLNIPTGTAPTAAASGDVWYDETSPAHFMCKPGDASDSIFLTSNDWEQLNVSTTTADLSAIDSMFVLVEDAGSATINTFGTSCRPGTVKVLQFADNFTLNYNPTGMLLVGNNMSIVAGDIVILHYTNATSGWVVIGSCRTTLGGGPAVSKLYAVHGFQHAEYDHGSTSDSASINWGNGYMQKWTLNNSPTLTFSSAQTGTIFKARIVHSGASRAITWPTIKWVGGVAPTLTGTDGAIDYVFFIYDGTNWLGMYATGFATP